MKEGYYQTSLMDDFYKFDSQYATSCLHKEPHSKKSYIQTPIKQESKLPNDYLDSDFKQLEKLVQEFQ